MEGINRIQRPLGEVVCNVLESFDVSRFRASLNLIKPIPSPSTINEEAYAALDRIFNSQRVGK